MEILVVTLTAALLLAIIIANYKEAVLVERRNLAQQTLLTVAGFQERWFVRRYEYARTINELGGADTAGDNYVLKLTQDPCGNTTCYTVMAVAVNEQAADRTCEKMTINHLGMRKAFDFRNQDTTKECWERS